jgi:hypothetical protein
MLEFFKGMLVNKYGKASFSKIVPVLWFVYLIFALSVPFYGKDVPNVYYELTLAFCGTYAIRAGIDKFKDATTTSTATSTLVVETPTQNQ